MKRSITNKSKSSNLSSTSIDVEAKPWTKPPTSQFRRRRKPRKTSNGYLSTSFPLVLLLFAVLSIGVLIRRPSFHHYGYPERVKEILTTDEISKESSNNNNHQEGTRESLESESFPVSFEGDVEEVTHPAIQYGAKIPEGLPKTLLLPKFWNPMKYGGNVRRYLGNGDVLMTKEVASSIGSFHEGKETVLVGIASYRDPECRKTVESLYLRAEYPSRIRTIVVDQLREGDIKCTQPEQSCEDDPEQVLCKFSHLIHSFELDARLAVGPTFARHIAQRHYRGEYFVLQIDAHVRFVQSWDSDIIQQWKPAGEMAVLSTYMLDLNGSIDQVTQKSKKTSRALLCNVFFEGGILRNGQQAARPPAIHGTPTIHPFWAAGFSFSRGHFVVQVPYDQYLPQVFQGEEMSIALRGFSYGYDYYAPERNVCFHMYALNKYRNNRMSVPQFSENKSTFKGVAGEAMKRLISILGMNNDKTEPYNRLEEDKYGIGRVRSLQTFFSTFGIDVKSQTVENHLCWFVGEGMQRKFLPALRKDGMGVDYDQVNYTFIDPAPDQP